jgi:hypothetical protein
MDRRSSETSVARNSQVFFPKVKFMLGGNEDVEINNINNTKHLREALNHANFGNIRPEDVNTDVDVATEADLNDINHFTEGHQQAEEQDQALESEEESPITESSMKLYSDAFKTFKRS